MAAMTMLMGKSRSSMGKCTTTTTTTTTMNLPTTATTTTSDMSLVALTASPTLAARAILNESPSATPSGSVGNSNENGVTVNIVGIGVGFVGGALSLIALTLITKLLIARRRARENGTPRPQLWDIVFDGGTNQGRLAIGRSLGGWDYGMDIWSTRGGVGLWGLTGGVGGLGEPLGEKPRLVEVVLGKSEEVCGEMKEWRPTTTFLHSTTPDSTTTTSPSTAPKPTLKPSSIISTAVLILLPTPETPWPLPLPLAPITSARAGAFALNDETDGKKLMVQHIEDTGGGAGAAAVAETPESRYWNRVNETIGEDGQALSAVAPQPSATHHESALDDEELEDLPDFVVGVLKMVVVDEEDEGVVAAAPPNNVGGELPAEKSIGGSVMGFFGR